VLPVHYQGGDGVAEAREDLASVGQQRVAVWDDESAKGANAWGVPPLEELGARRSASGSSTSGPTSSRGLRADRLLRRRAAANPTGGWTYLLDDMTPRPVAVTLAVFASKDLRREAGRRLPVGEGGVLRLFEREGQALGYRLVPQGGGRAVRLRVGGGRSP